MPSEIDSEISPAVSWEIPPTNITGFIFCNFFKSFSAFLRVSHDNYFLILFENFFRNSGNLGISLKTTSVTSEDFLSKILQENS